MIYVKLRKGEEDNVYNRVESQIEHGTYQELYPGEQKATITVTRTNFGDVKALLATSIIMWEETERILENKGILNEECKVSVNEISFDFKRSDTEECIIEVSHVDWKVEREHETLNLFDNSWYPKEKLSVEFEPDYEGGYFISLIYDDPPDDELAGRLIQYLLEKDSLYTINLTISKEEWVQEQKDHPNR